MYICNELCYTGTNWLMFTKNFSSTCVKSMFAFSHDMHLYVHKASHPDSTKLLKPCNQSCVRNSPSASQRDVQHPGLLATGAILCNQNG